MTQTDRQIDGFSTLYSSLASVPALSCRWGYNHQLDNGMLTRDGRYWNFDITIIVKQNITIIAIIVLSVFALKIAYKCINLSILYLIIVKLAMTKSDYDDIIRLLPLTIIVYSKNYTISIIIKENIMVNRQNRLIAHL